MFLVPSTSSIPLLRWALMPTAILLVAATIGAREAQAQLFGARAVGEPLAQPGTSGGVAGQSAGILLGSERFLRGNRSRRDFVGSDRNEASGFVGATQALGVGRVLSATENLRIETVSPTRINRPLPEQPAEGMYYPRLELGFERPQPPGQRPGSTANEKLRARVERLAGPDVQVILQDRVAWLLGTVSSQREAELAAQILSFEPGVDSVRNELTLE